MKIITSILILINLLFSQDIDYSKLNQFDVQKQVDLAESMYQGDDFISKKDFKDLSTKIKKINEDYKGPFDFILYFTSSSVPTDTMLNVLHSISILQDNNIHIYSKQYLIGVPEDFDKYMMSIKDKTESKYKNLTIQEKVKRNFGLKIDPRYFEKLDLKEAPAIAFATCPNITPDIEKCNIKYLIRGDVSLYTFLDKISEKDPKYEILTKILIANKIVDKEDKKNE